MTCSPIINIWWLMMVRQTIESTNVPIDVHHGGRTEMDTDWSFGAPLLSVGLFAENMDNVGND